MCKDGGEAMPTFVVKVIELSREVVETKRDNGKLVDHNTYFLGDLEDCRAAERLAWDKLERAEGLVKTLKAHVAKLDMKYSSTVEEATQTKEMLHVGVTSYGSSLKTRRKMASAL